MINEIKTIIQNYLDNIKLCCIMTGTVTDGGIRISENKPPIPMKLVTGNLKSTVCPGQKVRLLRNHGGQQFYILEVIADDT